MNNGRNNTIYLLGGLPNSASRSSKSSNSLNVNTENSNSVKVNNENTSKQKENVKASFQEHNLDQRVTAILGSTEPNSGTRENFLNGLVKFGQITKSEKEYLMGV